MSIVSAEDKEISTSMNTILLILILELYPEITFGSNFAENCSDEDNTSLFSE